MRGGALTHGVAFGAVVAVALAASVWSPGAKEHPLATWPMIGHDVENSRSQPDEGLIKRSTVDRLSPAWTFVTGGDVSATPAVDVEQDESGRTRTVVYFPDWGGNLWKLDADSKQVVWTRLIGSYNGIAGSISRTSPALHDGMLYVGDLRGNMMGIDAAPIQFPSISFSLVVLLVVFFLLGYTFYAALFAAVGAMVNSEQEAQQAQLPIVMLLIISIMFLQPVLNAPDGKLANLLTWLPFSSPIVMPLRMSAVSVPAWEVAASIFALAAGCYIAVWIAARIYRTGLLMYGKRPTMFEVARWVREAR